jgi:hypothetical protein
LNKKDNKKTLRKGVKVAKKNKKKKKKIPPQRNKGHKEKQIVVERLL